MLPRPLDWSFMVPATTPYKSTKSRLPDAENTKGRRSLHLRLSPSLGTPSPHRPFHNLRALQSGDQPILKLQNCEKVDRAGLMIPLDQNECHPPTDLLQFYQSPSMDELYPAQKCRSTDIEALKLRKFRSCQNLSQVDELGI